MLRKHFQWTFRLQSGVLSHRSRSFEAKDPPSLPGGLAERTNQITPIAADFKSAKFRERNQAFPLFCRSKKPRPFLFLGGLACFVSSHCSTEPSDCCHVIISAAHCVRACAQKSRPLKSGGSQFKLNQAARGKLFLSSLYGVPIFRSKI